jgi:hypothetical protein
MKLPKLWRKKRGGREVGSYHATVKGDDVNLGTSDAKEAHARLLEAVRKGRRNFGDEVAEAAAALDDVSEPPAVVAGDGPRAPAPPAAALTLPPAQPDAYIPPPPPPAGDADDMAAAAEEVAGDAGAGAAPPEVDPSVLDQLLENAGAMLVEAQLGLQAAIVHRRTGKIAAPVPADSPLRTAAAAAWGAQLKIWFPADVMLPPWAMALILPALAMPAQFAGATEPPADQGAQPQKVAA